MNRLWFEQEPEALHAVEAILKARYPTLHAFIEDGKCRVRGTYSLTDGGRQIDRYQIELVLPDDYPASPPRVWETAERIPRDPDRHVYVDGALCLATPLALWIELDGRFTIDRVLDIPVRNFLIGNGLVEQGEPWPHGDRSHGAEGILEHFGELIGTSEPMTVARLLLDLVNEKVRGHWPCPCRSGRIIRNCHKDSFEKLRKVPKEELARSGCAILDELKAQRDEAGKAQMRPHAG